MYNANFVVESQNFVKITYFVYICKAITIQLKKEQSHYNLKLNIFVVFQIITTKNTLFCGGFQAILRGFSASTVCFAGF
jgi:hypothetical protein